MSSQSSVFRSSRRSSASVIHDFILFLLVAHQQPKTVEYVRRAEIIVLLVSTRSLYACRGEV